MPIICAGNGHSHDTVDEVRACQMGAPVPQVRPVSEIPLEDPDWKRRAPDGVIRMVSDLTEGMWIVPDVEPPEIFKIQLAVHGSGKLYAKKLVRPEQPGMRARFEYSPGIMSYIARNAQPMTLEQAIKFGELYGACCRCGRVLTNEDSIEAGIGPICAGKFLA